VALIIRRSHASTRFFPNPQFPTHCSIHHCTMPRAPLREIVGNSRRGKDLTTFQLGEISGLAKDGAGPAKQGHVLNLAPETCRDATKRILTRSTTKPAPKPGRPISYTNREERSILRAVKANPKIKIKDIQFESGVKRCPKTIRKILKKSGVRHWVSKKRPSLTNENAEARNIWCTAQKNWTTSE
jgi:hypothetical protein